jgi:hypothetical protein
MSKAVEKKQLVDVRVVSTCTDGEAHTQITYTSMYIFMYMYAHNYFTF